MNYVEGVPNPASRLKGLSLARTPSRSGTNATGKGSFHEVMSIFYL